MIILFTVMMFAVLGSLISLAVRAAWGLTKILFGIVFLPGVLVLLAAAGLIKLALPLLLVIGAVSLLESGSTYR